MESAALSQIGLAGLAVMGQNLALNIAEKGFPISVYNRTTSKVDETLDRAHREGNLPLSGQYNPRDFVLSIKKPRSVIILVKAGAPVDQTIAALAAHMEPGDTIIDGGNEWYEDTERRISEASNKGLLYLGMGVSGGEDGARNGPSLMPGGSHEAYLNIRNILEKVAAQVDDGPCVAYIGEGGSGNFVKMVHNGIEYGDMQLISEAYDVLKNVGGLGNDDLAGIFEEWNRGELESFLIEITSDIFRVKDEETGNGGLVDKILDKTGMKGTGKWTVQQAAELSIAAPTIAASLDSRYMSGLKEERVAASEIFKKEGLKEDINNVGVVDKKRLIDDVRQALYASKICSYAQGMNLLRAKSVEKGWNLNLGELARIWKGGCIIRAVFLDRIKQAYQRNPGLANLLVDPEFAREMVQRQAAWRRVVGLAIQKGISVPGMSASLQYFDTYRRGRLPANLVQAQRDYFGAHTYERIDCPGSFHTEWSKLARKARV
ncbi:6-phosphogluconate dehydrogenase, decarboxylating 2, chloroplastic-like [Olea europaea var. sylvestris]|uniref:6-phosphogluconate dehydrogenase, decarboxylating 2, chloroplastic-like n=1 Tax=Olea europaea var. sylvestris TaxID=158386 RepID=UPI000C1D1BBF|nr:6-phosphogluconate dehydrogenase, decarboxylating 2, chloroplastic-like [Olea europaea var. sylvestris]